MDSIAQPKTHRKLFRVILLIIACISFSVLLALLWNNFFSSNLIASEENIQASVPISGIPTEAPIRIQIPSIGVDAVVGPVGLTKLNTMDVPKKPMDTGWFKLGPIPGEKGSAVIAGHRGFRNEPAIFDNLHKIKIGDEVMIKDEKGEERIFIVRKMQTYGAKEQVADVWIKDDSEYLNLITCSGRWNPFTRTSDERLVVFTELKS
jgi:LPXTG-site transpeptidase (sortase) family protein